MEHLPIFINLKQKPVLVIGGGDIALRKINLLIKAQAKVNCLSPLFCEEIKNLSMFIYIGCCSNGVRGVL